MRLFAHAFFIFTSKILPIQNKKWSNSIKIACIKIIFKDCLIYLDYIANFNKLKEESIRI